VNRNSGGQGGNGASTGTSADDEKDAEIGQLGFDVAGLSSLEEEEAARAYATLLKQYSERVPHLQLSVPYWISNRAMMPLVVGREPVAKGAEFRVPLQPVPAELVECNAAAPWRRLEEQGEVVVRGGAGVH